VKTSKGVFQPRTFRGLFFRRSSVHRRSSTLWLCRLVLFGWSFVPDPNSGGRYHLVSHLGAEQPSGGIVDTGGAHPNHAIFLVQVDDVAATVAAAEGLGGKVLVPPATTPDGLTFADLQDSAGNHFGVSLPRGRHKQGVHRTCHQRSCTALLRLDSLDGPGEQRARGPLDERDARHARGTAVNARPRAASYHATKA
jgi:predicted enzyme related to lactoylglutathione lyase